MLSNGADPDIRDEFGRTPVYYLASSLSSWGPLSVLNSMWSFVIAKLVQNGAKLNYRDITGTPVLHALTTSYLENPRLLDEKFWLEILNPKYKVDVNVQDYYNRTVLHLISAKGEK